MFGSSPLGQIATSPVMVRATKHSKRAVVEDVPGQAERLKRLREALGYDTSTAFANFLDLLPNRYNNFENGLALSREVVFRMVQKVPGLSVDWLWFGKPDGLSVSLAQRLGELGPSRKPNH
jgi:hypothetical protein